MNIARPLTRMFQINCWTLNCINVYWNVLLNIKGPLSHIFTISAGAKLEEPAYLHLHLDYVVKAGYCRQVLREHQTTIANAARK